MKKDIYDSFIEIVSGMRNFKSYGGMSAKQAGALAAIFNTIGYDEDISYYRFIMGDE